MPEGFTAARNEIARGAPEHPSIEPKLGLYHVVDEGMLDVLFETRAFTFTGTSSANEPSVSARVSSSVRARRKITESRARRDRSEAGARGAST